MYYTMNQTRKQSLEEEISLCHFMLSIENRKDIKAKITGYLGKVEEELLSFLR